jgi:hypothetical protein
MKLKSNLTEFLRSRFRTKYWYMTNYKVYDFYMKHYPKYRVLTEYKEGIILPIRRLLFTFVSNTIYDFVVQFPRF